MYFILDAVENDGGVEDLMDASCNSEKEKKKSNQGLEVFSKGRVRHPDDDRRTTYDTELVTNWKVYVVESVLRRQVCTMDVTM